MSEYVSNMSKPRERKVFESPESLKAEIRALRENINTLSEKPIEVAEDTIDGLLGNVGRLMIYNIVCTTADSADAFNPYIIIVCMDSDTKPVQIKIDSNGLSMRKRIEVLWSVGGSVNSSEEWGDWESYVTHNDLTNILLSYQSKLTDTQLENIDAIPDLQPKLTFDDTPTIGSDSPVTSDGIYKALQSKMDFEIGYEDEIDEYTLGEHIYKIVDSSASGAIGGGVTGFNEYYLFVSGKSTLSGMRINTLQIKFKDGKMYTRRYTKDITMVMTPEGYIIEKDPGTWSDWTSFVTITEAEEVHSDLQEQLHYHTTQILSKQDLVTISDVVSSDGTIMMNNNTETRLTSVPIVNDVPTLILNLPDSVYGIVLEYMSWVIFPACDVTPSVTVVGDISWSGVDCDETGAFTPVAGVNYRLQVCNIGVSEFEPILIGNVARW